MSTPGAERRDIGTIDVYLALGRSGRVMAHVLEPPGLGRSFPDRAALEAELHGAIAEHFAWLHARGHVSAVPSPLASRVAAELGSRAASSPATTLVRSLPISSP